MRQNLGHGAQNRRATLVWILFALGRVAGAATAALVARAPRRDAVHHHSPDLRVVVQANAPRTRSGQTRSRSRPTLIGSQAFPAYRHHSTIARSAGRYSG